MAKQAKRMDWNDEKFREVLGIEKFVPDSTESTKQTLPDEPTAPTVNTVQGDEPTQTTPTPEESTSSVLQSPQTESASLKRIGSKQRKASFDEYRQTFLQVPRLNDRKPVFVSAATRDSLDKIVRQLGDRKMSVSGFIETLALHHLETYAEDIEQWRKL